MKLLRRFMYRYANRKSSYLRTSLLRLNYFLDQTNEYQKSASTHLFSEYVWLQGFSCQKKATTGKTYPHIELNRQERNERFHWEARRVSQRSTDIGLGFIQLSRCFPFRIMETVSNNYLIIDIKLPRISIAVVCGQTASSVCSWKHATGQFKHDTCKK